MILRGLIPIALSRQENAIKFIVVYPPLFQRGVRGDFLNKSPSIPLLQRGKLLKINGIRAAGEDIHSVLQLDQNSATP
ncbi:hypothetical protein AYM39_21190 [Methylomonas sp. DH-1]|nr:hypothetical protein AYM39_21190 [Methylomonas sp. DH-1]